MTDTFKAEQEKRNINYRPTELKINWVMDACASTEKNKMMTLEVESCVAFVR